MKKYKIFDPVSEKAPNDENLVKWAQRDVHPFMRTCRKVVNWIVDQLGKVGVDSEDKWDYAEYKLLQGTGITITKNTGIDPDGDTYKTLTFAATGGPGSDDHEVKADSTDTGHGALTDKIKAGTHVTKTVVTDGGAKKVQLDVSWPTVPTASTEDPLPDGDADPGDTSSNEYAAKRHVHPIASPAATGGVLYTGYHRDPLVLGEVDALYSGYYVCDTALFAGFTQVSTGKWVRDEAGALDSSYTDYVPPFVGMKVLAWHSGIDLSEMVHAWIYELTDTGAFDGLTPHYTTFQRVDSLAPPINGMSVVVNNGDSHAGTWYLYCDAPIPVLGLSALSWSKGDAYTATDADVLVDASRIATWITPGLTATFETDVTSSADVLLGTCQTPEGFPAASAIPVGPWIFKTLALVTVDNPAATITIKKVLRKFTTGGSHTTIASVETASFHESAPLVRAATYNFAAEYTLSPSERLEVEYYAHTTSATPVHVVMIYSDTAHTTRIETSMTFGFLGTDDHHLLTNRHVYDDHHAGDIGPGRFHTPFDTTVATSSGKLTMPDRNNAKVSGTEDLLGIATAGWMPGDVIRLTFTQARKLNHAGSPGAGFAPLRLLKVSASVSDRNVQLSGANASVSFQLEESSASWEQITPVVYTPS